jgi:hypothetical protein
MRAPRNPERHWLPGAGCGTVVSHPLSKLLLLVESTVENTFEESLQDLTLHFTPVVSARSAFC